MTAARFDDRDLFELLDETMCLELCLEWNHRDVNPPVDNEATIQWRRGSEKIEAAVRDWMATGGADALGKLRALGETHLPEGRWAPNLVGDDGEPIDHRAVCSPATDALLHCALAVADRNRDGAINAASHCRSWASIGGNRTVDRALLAAAFGEHDEIVLDIASVLKKDWAGGVRALHTAAVILRRQELR